MCRALLLLLAALSGVAAPGPLRFKITLDPAAVPMDGRGRALSGRLIVLMSDHPTKADRLEAGFVPTGDWLAATEIEAIRPGQTVLFNPDLEAYPSALSRVPKRKLQLMALLDPDHSYVRERLDEGDLYSEVVQLDVDPAHTEPVALTLARRQGPPARFDETANLKIVEMESRLLTAFWGRSVKVRAGLVLPPSYASEPKKQFPAVYNIHGFGGNHLRGLASSGAQILNEMQEKKRGEMIHVFLDGSFATGHHVFADSVNSVPWGSALTTEFIPYLEKRYRLIAKPHARFLTGHSSPAAGAHSGSGSTILPPLYGHQCHHRFERQRLPEGRWNT